MIFLKIIFFITICFTFCETQAQNLNSSLGVYQSFDNDKNQSSAVDISIATQAMAIIKTGLSQSSYQYDDVTNGRNNSFYLGLSSNPLRDWVFEGLLQYTKVSEQMKIVNPSFSIRKFFSQTSFEVEVGYRQIETQITPGLALVTGTSKRVNEDHNYWWSFNSQINLIDSFQIGVSYLKYQYSTRFDFFNYPIAETLGYSLDTINFGSSFADFVYSINLSYNYKKWFSSLDYTFSKNAFDDSNAKSLTPRLGYQLNPFWALDLSISGVRGTSQDRNNVDGSVLGLGLTYFW